MTESHSPQNLAVAARLARLLNAIDDAIEKGAPLNGFDWPAISAAHDALAHSAVESKAFRDVTLCPGDHMNCEQCGAHITCVESPEKT